MGNTICLPPPVKPLPIEVWEQIIVYRPRLFMFVNKQLHNAAMGHGHHITHRDKPTNDTLTQLRVLSLYVGENTAVNNVHDLTALTSLVVVNASISMRGLTALRTLILRKTTMPCICRFYSLVQLELVNCGTWANTDGCAITLLTNLTSLKVTGDSYVPFHVLSQLPVRYLDVSYNGRMGRSIDGLDLLGLNVTGCGVLTHGFAKMTNLHSLSAGSCVISLWNFPKSLTQLDLTMCDILYAGAIDADINRLTSLTHLSASGTPITKNMLAIPSLRTFVTNFTEYDMCKTK